jgi:hypothetical protein
MSRNVFGSWGLELDADNFACALATIGTACAETGWGLSDDLLRRSLKSVAGREGPVPWNLPGLPLDRFHMPSAQLLVNSWKEFIREGSRPIRIEIQGWRETPSLVPWLVSELSRPSVESTSVFLLDEYLEAPLRWRFPLRVGVLAGGETTRLINTLKSGLRSWGWAKLVDLKAPSDQYDILLITGSLREGAAELLRVKDPLRTGCVFVLGGMSKSWVSCSHLMSVILKEAASSGICILDIPDSEVEKWFRNFVGELSHNSPIDVSLFLTTYGLYPGSTSSGRRRKQPLLFASRGLLERSRLINVTLDLADRLEASRGAKEIKMPERVVELLDLEAPKMKPEKIGGALRAKAPDFTFRSEREEATDIADMTTRAERSMRSATPPHAEPRWIQAKTYELSENGRRQEVVRALRAAARYAVNVRIAPTDADWLMPDDKGVFPDWELPPSRDGHKLQVVFSEPHHAPEPQVASLSLPPSGASTQCRFYFKTLETNPRFEARIIVLFKNRVLQTALLRATVLPEPSEADKDSRLNLDIEAVVRPNLTELETRQEFGGALVVNETTDGGHTATGISGDRATLFSLESISDCVKNIRDKLEEVASEPKKYEGGIHAKATAELLQYLAWQGSSLFEVLNDELADNPIMTADRVQIISTKTASLLPLEYVYELPVPTEAKLCPKSTKLLRTKSKRPLQTGVCSTCKNKKKNQSNYICPFGFWCLSRVIERYANDQTLDRRLNISEFALRAEPIGERSPLTPLKSAVYAASSKVDKGEPGRIEKVFSSLDQATKKKAANVNTWKKWVKEAKRLKPSLLLILPHTYDYMDQPGMEIGNNEQLHVLRIGKEHLGVSEDHLPPIVLLLGCNTEAIEIPFQGLVAKFRREGAAIVLSTLTPVLGRHAAPVAQATIKLLEKITKTDSLSFGDVMMRLRRMALAEGIPMALCLFAHGDADWRIGKA